MLPGPVFTFEMMTTARRGRFYSLRALYAIVLLLILWMIHTSWTAETEGELSVRLVPWFGLSAFGAITVGQEILVLTLTPALVAGAIADEKRRKTLHYLLASQLTGPEIVLGKLLVRMLYVGVLLGVSFPVMSMLVLMGGVDPILVLVCCGALLSTAWFLATLSIWVSTIARSPREALFVTFGLEALWIVVPLVASGVSTGWGAVDRVLWELAEWVGASSPVSAFVDIFRSMNFGAPMGFEQTLLWWMIGLQAGTGVVLALLAAVQLRPVFKRQDGAVARPRGLRALLTSHRLRSHPPLGDRPMLWKELHTQRARGFARIVGWLLTLILGGLLLYHGAWYALMAFLEVWERGYGSGWGWMAHRGRWEFFGFLKVVIPLVYLLWALAIAGAAAATMTSEHEDDTWVSLTATDLTGREIVLAKLIGSMWRPRRLFSVIVLLLAAGIGVESLHYLSLPSIVLAMAVYGWFAAALGVWISMQLRSTWRAQFLTIALLLLINLTGQGILNMASPRGFAPNDWPGFTPYEVAKLALEPPFFERFDFSGWPRFWQLWDVDESPEWLATFSIISLLGYGSLASVLTWHALRRFEVVAGRAQRRRGVLLPSADGPRLDAVASPQPT
jgi:ABC-type transport system involved in multi-copper enzyme maturation permease subunit